MPFRAIMQMRTGKCIIKCVNIFLRRKEYRQFKQWYFLKELELHFFFKIYFAEIIYSVY